MALATTHTVVQPPQPQAGKHTIYLSQAHQIPLFASKKSQKQSLPTMQSLFIKISGKNTESLILPSKAHNKVLVRAFTTLRFIRTTQLGR